MTIIDRTNYIEKFTGNLWYVTKAGNNSNSGKRPDDARLTLEAGLDAMSANDKLMAYRLGTNQCNGIC